MALKHPKVMFFCTKCYLLLIWDVCHVQNYFFDILGTYHKLTFLSSQHHCQIRHCHLSFICNYVIITLVALFSNQLFQHFGKIQKFIYPFIQPNTKKNGFEVIKIFFLIKSEKFWDHYFNWRPSLSQRCPDGLTCFNCEIGLSLRR